MGLAESRLGRSSMSSREQEIREGAAANLQRDLGKSKIERHAMLWDKYVAQNRITSDQSTQLQRFCSTDTSVRAETLRHKEKAEKICKGLIDIATLPKGQSTLMDSLYVLTHIDNIIVEDPSRVELFREMNVRDRPIFVA